MTRYLDKGLSVIGLKHLRVYLEEVKKRQYPIKGHSFFTPFNIYVSGQNSVNHSEIFQISFQLVL